jgi:hypothetical protein
MRLAMISYFDLGESYGLGDTVFHPSRLAPGYDTGDVGIVNPLGRGVLVDLQRDHSDVVQRWRAAAVEQVGRPEMELGFDPALGLSPAAFAERLQAVISRHPLTRCDLTIFAVGVALVCLEFGADLPVEFMRGLGRCFEYAAYTPRVSEPVFELARSEAQAAVVGLARNGLVALTRREGPRNVTDAEGYTESSLLTGAGFTSVVLAVDVGDHQRVGQAMTVMDMEEQAPEVAFEFHGTLRFEWATCLLEARNLDRWTGGAEEGGETPQQAIGRMQACIEIAHTFLGTCEAFYQLFLAEMQAQVAGFASSKAAGRQPEELNRLRTLALAVVSVTNFDLVTPTEEDRRYFRLFDQEAKVGQRQRFIQDACEILYNVQEAEVQGEQAKRDRTLGYILGGLTSLTVISVSVDAYNFVREDQPLVQERLQRVQLLVEFLLLLGVVALLVFFMTRRRLARGRSSSA